MPKQEERDAFLELVCRLLQPQVYFLEQGEGGPIKIGSSSDTGNRRGDLQTGSAIELRILASMPGSRKTEREIQRHFELFKLDREWFLRTPQLLDWIARHTTLWTPYDRARAHRASQFAKAARQASIKEGKDAVSCATDLVAKACRSQ